MKPRVIIEQKITAFANKYDVYAAQPDGSKGELQAFAQQKRFAFKEKVTFYTDEQKTTTAFSFRAEKALDVHGRYFVEDATGQPVGAFRKVFGKSLLNSTWQLLDGDQPVITITESNKLLAILRRFAGAIPVVGDFIELIVLFFKYHFVFSDSATGEVVGTYTKTALFRDHYRLDVTDAGYQKFDWTVFAAMSVALDALQSR